MTPFMSCFTTYLVGNCWELAVAFCPPWATIFSRRRLARWTAPTGMPVCAAMARTLRPAASNGATLARLVSWVSSISAPPFSHVANKSRALAYTAGRRAAVRVTGDVLRRTACSRAYMLSAWLSVTTEATAPREAGDRRPPGFRIS
jgi:hypothetical protein